MKTLDAVSAAIISYLWERRKDDCRNDEANWSQDPVEALLEEAEAQSLAWLKEAARCHDIRLIPNKAGQTFE